MLISYRTRIVVLSDIKTQSMDNTETIITSGYAWIPIPRLAPSHQKKERKKKEMWVGSSSVSAMICICQAGCAVEENVQFI